MYAMFASSFFMSIGFPTIFALGIRGLGEHTKLGSSLIVMSIVGRAIAAPFMEHIADRHDKAGPHRMKGRTSSCSVIHCS
jgi:FHS family L-fucose permease-like MFS transporter